MSKHVPAKKTASPKNVAAAAKKSPAKIVQKGKVVAAAAAPAAPARAVEKENEDLNDEVLKKRLNPKALRRLFLRAGCARIAGTTVYPVLRRLMRDRLMRDVRHATAHANLAQLKTLKTEHVRGYYESIGRRLYGKPESAVRTVTPAPDAAATV